MQPVTITLPFSAIAAPMRQAIPPARCRENRRYSRSPGRHWNVRGQVRNLGTQAGNDALGINQGFRATERDKRDARRAVRCGPVIDGIGARWRSLAETEIRAWPLFRHETDGRALQFTSLGRHFLRRKLRISRSHSTRQREGCRLFFVNCRVAREGVRKVIVRDERVAYGSTSTYRGRAACRHPGRLQRLCDIRS